MGQLIKRFQDGSYLEYDTGKFDDWCVYVSRPNAARTAPRDMDYFKQLKEYAEKYGADKIYDDCVRVYKLVGKEANDEALGRISDIASWYDNDAIEIDIVFSVLYMAMISEERKANTRLGKRIKRLGIHMLLMEHKRVSEAADCTRGMKWREIDALCKERGF